MQLRKRFWRMTKSAPRIAGGRADRNKKTPAQKSGRKRSAMQSERERYGRAVARFPTA
jgi:hypothetical protein